MSSTNTLEKDLSAPEMLKSAPVLRRWLNETPVFEEMRQRVALSRELPLRAVLKSHGRPVTSSVISRAHIQQRGF